MTTTTPTADQATVQVLRVHALLADYAQQHGPRPIDQIRRELTTVLAGRCVDCLHPDPIPASTEIRCDACQIDHEDAQERGLR